MNVKIEISIYTGLMLNDHSHPYIGNTTVLSDKYINVYIILMYVHTLYVHNTIDTIDYVTGIGNLSRDPHYTRIIVQTHRSR